MAPVSYTHLALTKIGVVPIINENDTVATAELKHIENFGDNDTPVSYTHLDVYKRQPLGNTPPRPEVSTVSPTTTLESSRR